MEKNVKEMQEDGISSKFVKVPLNSLFILDSDCLKMLTLLLQEESYWKSRGKLTKDGCFFKSLGELQDDMLMSNEQDVRLTIEALYLDRWIDVIPQGNKRKANKFKINYSKIEEINGTNITDVRKFYPQVSRLPRGTKCTYSLVGKASGSTSIIRLEDSIEFN